METELKTPRIGLTIHDDPYRWVETPPGLLLDLEEAQVLARSFPAGDYVLKDESQRQEKAYRNLSRPVRADSVWYQLETLPAQWRSLIEFVATPRYAGWVSAILEFDPESLADVEIRLVRHAVGGLAGPHTDRDDKLFSHIVYFDERWGPDWGGSFQVLRSDDPADVVASVIPGLGNSVMLRRSDHSWHQVTPVTPSAGADRQSLLIHGHAR